MTRPIPGQLREKIARARFVVTCTEYTRWHRSPLPTGSKPPSTAFTMGSTQGFSTTGTPSELTSPHPTRCSVLPGSCKEGDPDGAAGGEAFAGQGVRLAYTLIGDGQDRETPRSHPAAGARTGLPLAGGAAASRGARALPPRGPLRSRLRGGGGRRPRRHPQRALREHGHGGPGWWPRACRPFLSWVESGRTGWLVPPGRPRGAGRRHARHAGRRRPQAAGDPRRPAAGAAGLRQPGAGGPIGRHLSGRPERSSRRLSARILISGGSGFPAANPLSRPKATPAGKPAWPAIERRDAP